MSSFPPQGPDSEIGRASAYMQRLRDSVRDRHRNLIDHEDGDSWDLIGWHYRQWALIDNGYHNEGT
jgi:hypothetical protein